MIPFMIKSIFWEIFIYLDFDTVDHSILLKILEHYETKGRKLSFFFKVIYQVVSNTFSIYNKTKLETQDCQI